ncbi:unnamed protein product [Prorocentrum cordatum]|uniref:Uncharacterized protein n=1 Tax=Prorocentrum cordatum TaxID=2364126 RepID=A0ABN9QEH8_9DINO|nr:unnamed protein product [Polarella glacialis]
MAAAASRRRGMATSAVLVRRASTLVDIQLWRRAAAMVSACLPVAHSGDAIDLMTQARMRRWRELGRWAVDDGDAADDDAAPAVRLESPGCVGPAADGERAGDAGVATARGGCAGEAGGAGPALDAAAVPAARPGLMVAALRQGFGHGGLGGEAGGVVLAPGAAAAPAARLGARVAALRLVRGRGPRR